MTDQTLDGGGEEFKELVAQAPDTKVAAAHGIAAIALSMALKYHDINTVQDGQLYQQYKLEGRNMRDLNLDTVFETAIRIEMHLMAASERIAQIVVDALSVTLEDEPEGPDEVEEQVRSERSERATSNSPLPDAPKQEQT
jgi:hypothetical protein